MKSQRIIHTASRSTAPFDIHRLSQHLKHSHATSNTRIHRNRPVTLFLANFSTWFVDNRADFSEIEKVVKEEERDTEGADARGGKRGIVEGVTMPVAAGNNA